MKEEEEMGIWVMGDRITVRGWRMELLGERRKEEECVRQEEKLS